MTAAPSAVLLASLRRLGVVGPALPPMRPLAGGVSSEVWLVERPGGPVCVKRPLPRLNVAADWDAPLERSRYELAWLQLAGGLVPGFTPDVLAHEDGALVLAYLDHPRWKDELRDGRVDERFAFSLGARLGQVHAATARRPALAREFDSADVFAAMRLDPYLGVLAQVHPDLAAPLAELRSSFARHAGAVVHGDVTPKNILVAPSGPVLLDAECATWGDPAFDVGLCAAHLLLKCRWNPAAAPALLASYDALLAGHRSVVGADAALAARVDRWTAACLLARVDGRSPVEYLSGEDRARTREVSRRLVADPELDVRADWAATL